MSTSLIVAVMCLVLALTVIPGVWLWWPSRRDTDQRSSLGAALLTGAVVSFAVFAVQIVFDARLRDIDAQRQADQDRRAELQRVAADRAALQLTVGLQHDLTGIDLTDRNLSNFYLSRKLLPEAVLNGANLSGANLSGANLTGAQLQGADLEGAHLDGADLTNAVLPLANLSGAVLTQAKLANAVLSEAVLTGANLTGTDLRGTSFGGAKYDSATTWPRSARQPPCAAGKTCTVAPQTSASASASSNRISSAGGCRAFERLLATRPDGEHRARAVGAAAQRAENAPSRRYTLTSSIPSSARASSSPVDLARAARAARRGSARTRRPPRDRR